MTDYFATGFSEPWDVENRQECWFYHTTELPEDGEIKGHWDLRQCVNAYLGNVNFSGKRVLDIGAASGFLSFHMEKQGADVVSFDLANGADWDVVPHHEIIHKLPEIKAAQARSLISMKKAYWYAHRKLNSNARAYYGNVYDIPESIGKFDAVVYGMIIGHLRDVPHALYQGARLCRDTMVVISMFEKHQGNSARFAPVPDDSSNLRIKHWWGLNVETVSRMLAVLGFDVVDQVVSYPKVEATGFNQSAPECIALVAKRKNL